MEEERVDKLAKRYKESKEVFTSDKLKESEKAKKLTELKRKTFYLPLELEKELDQVYLRTSLDLGERISKIEFCNALLRAGLRNLDEIKRILKHNL